MAPLGPVPLPLALHTLALPRSPFLTCQRFAAGRKEDIHAPSSHPPPLFPLWQQPSPPFLPLRTALPPRHQQIAAIEQEIGCGQVEELIEQAKSELQLIPLYASWRLWEQKPPSPSDDDFSHLFDEIKELDGADAVDKTALGRQQAKTAKAIGGGAAKQ